MGSMEPERANGTRDCKGDMNTTCGASVDGRLVLKTSAGVGYFPMRKLKKKKI